MGRFQWLEFDDPAAKPGVSSLPEETPESGEDFTNPERVLKLADDAYRRLDYERALRLFSKVLSLDPNLEPGWAGQLKCLLDLDEMRRVREETQIFQTRQPLSYRSVVRKY